MDTTPDSQAKWKLNQLMELHVVPIGIDNFIFKLKILQILRLSLFLLLVTWTQMAFFKLLNIQLMR